MIETRSEITVVFLDFVNQWFYSLKIGQDKERQLFHRFWGQISLKEKKVKTVLITGPNGFIGRQLILDFKNQYPDWKIKVISRNPVEGVSGFLSFEDFCLGKFEDSYFEDINYLVHLAALAHRFSNINIEDLKTVNIDFLTKLLSQLKTGAIEKIVFMSSYSVSLLEKRIVLDTVDYAITKQQGERFLEGWFESNSKNCEVIILRPAMVYGSGAPGNFDRLIWLLKKPFPLPFGSLHFPRSFIHVKNLTSAVLAALETPVRSGVYRWDIADPWRETFSGFVTGLNSAISGRAKMFNFPVSLLGIILRSLGKYKLFKKITLSFEIDNKSFVQRYHWTPAIKFEHRFKDSCRQNK